MTSDDGWDTGEYWWVVLWIPLMILGLPFAVASLRVVLWPLRLRINRDGMAMALAGRRRTIRWEDVATVEIGWFEGRRCVLVHLNRPNTLPRLGSGLFRWPPFYIPKRNMVVFHQLRFVRARRRQLAAAFQQYAGRAWDQT
ncbi:hypothetical protein KZZ52_37240 [Dactylosporangium sp. AC04546]|uniref:hypothetical protein n=1 Tax=Dactylosporangium sp. AC04546 TaxID=2862460 RepID=UPI001EDE3628|nr:hypothetical protein [Dactylosporangium sp. AC04546]WVK79612.1 hypothetical protein KZZ52_37240 [Dactylosporangium sp. AC04546]